MLGIVCQIELLWLTDFRAQLQSYWRI